MIVRLAPASSRRGQAPGGSAALRCGRLVLPFVAGLSCSGPPGAGRQLGRDLGTFHTEASTVSNTCGVGAVGSQERFEFDVELSMDAGELFWDNNVGGTIDAARAFELESEVRVALRPMGNGAGCSVVRTDTVSGTLEADAQGTLEAFTGRLGYAFSAEPSSTCSVDDLLSQGLSRLPCSLEYMLHGVRTRAPEPLAEPTANLR
jgi:hypothetical protein